MDIKLTINKNMIFTGHYNVVVFCNIRDLTSSIDYHHISTLFNIPFQVILIFLDNIYKEYWYIHVFWHVDHNLLSVQRIFVEHLPKKQFCMDIFPACWKNIYGNSVSFIPLINTLFYPFIHLIFLLKTWVAQWVRQL